MFYLGCIISFQSFSARDEGITKDFDDKKFINPVYNYTMPTTEECGKYILYEITICKLFHFALTKEVSVAQR